MEDFVITDERINFICGRLGLIGEANVKMVRDLHRDFTYFYDSNVKTQHLAPIIMAMERYIQETFKRQNFKIVVSKMRGSNARCGIAFLRWKVNRYDICIPDSDDTVAIDNIIAHELGHLFYVMNCLYGKNATALENDGCLADKMADVIGIFTMSNRAEFYRTKAASTCQSNFDLLVKDFVKMGMGRSCSKKPLLGTAR